MPTLNIKGNTEVECFQDIKCGHVFEDQDGDVLLRTNEGAILLSLDDVGHVADNVYMETVGPFIDLGPLTVQR